MGCGASTERKDSKEPQKVSGDNKENADVEKLNETINADKANNLTFESDKKSNEVNDVISQVSLEVLISKPTKPKNAIIVKNTSTKSQRPKELNQVQAWGKKSSRNETNFLEDLRIQRSDNNPFYEREYELREVDETSRFIGADSGMIIDDDSVSEISNSDSSNQPVKINREGDQEESFDVSKIIDVEKFRAANIHVDDNNDNNNGKRKLSGEVQKLNSPSDNGEEGSYKDDFYNEDDKHLIESIEKEFTITQHNFLPGQIVN
ncbi:protein PFF0380w-like [Dendronephthya gigantea]|uniref:protein PFF0380w-like n=1 Tax=Dendronephthya gigantea TaxID=151771 RepID=UPI00106A0670|nr:protein PFF0380w-like [Dendronephthya gigantea]